MIQVIETRKEMKELESRQLIIKERPVRNKAHTAFDLRGFLSQVFPVNDDPPFRRFKNTGNHLDRCGLSCAIRPQKAEDDSPPDL